MKEAEDLRREAEAIELKTIPVQTPNGFGRADDQQKITNHMGIGDEV